MRQKSEMRVTPKQINRIVKDIHQATRKHHSAEEKIRVVLEGLRGQCSIAELCQREGSALKLSSAVKRAETVECEVLRDELRVAHDAEWVVDIDTAANFILGEEFGKRTADLRRHSNYQRRAHSLRRKALRRLDYERVEAKRRRVADANHQRSGRIG